MSWKAAISKYRNTTVTAHKKEEWYTFETSAIYTSTDNVPIATSKTLIATKLQSSGTCRWSRRVMQPWYRVGQSGSLYVSGLSVHLNINTPHGIGGGNIAIWPLNQPGRLPTNPPVLSLSSPVVDLDFSPFNHGLLATGAEDGSTRISALPPEGITADSGLSFPTTSLPAFLKRVETVRFHPTAADVISVTSQAEISIYNIQSNSKAISFDNDGAIVNSLSWKDDGSLFVTTARDNVVRVYDPRATSKVVASCKIHDGVKPGRSVWCGVTDQIATTGFSRFRDRGKLGRLSWQSDTLRLRLMVNRRVWYLRSSTTK